MKCTQQEENLTKPTDIQIVISDLVALFLETINNIVSYSLKDNPYLTYALLLKIDLFIPLKEFERMAMLAENIEKVFRVEFTKTVL